MKNKRFEKRRTSHAPEALERRQLLSTVLWSSTSGGAWTTASNWSGGVVPGASDDVIIDQPGNIQISLTGSTSVKSVSVSNDTLIVNNGTLGIAANSSIGASATLTLNTSSISLATGASLTNGGHITVNPGSQLSVGGALNQSAGSSLTLPAGTASTGIGTNLLGNSSFESPTASGATTQPGSWGQWNSSYVSTQYAHTGSQSLVQSGTNSGVDQSFSVSPGVSYSASIWGLNPTSGSLTNAEAAFMNISFSNSSGTTISTGSKWIDLVNSASATGTWKNITATTTAPAGAATVFIAVQVGYYYNNSNAGSGNAYLDDFQFGPTAISTGSVSAASISNSGNLTIGAGDRVTTSGSFVQNTGAVLTAQLGGPAAGNFFGSLTAGGSATLGGTFNATLVNGYAPSINDNFTLLSASSESGSFSAYQLPSGSNYTFASAANPTYFGISAVPTSITTTVNASSDISSATNHFIGVNLAYWDSLLSTSQTQSTVQAAGLSLFRFPGGSASDDYHFNAAGAYGDSAANTIPQFAQFIANVGGTGIVTTDYGSGSPQEAEAELAYLEGSTTDTTAIGTGIEWNDSASAWQNVNWQTVGYWASLRTASPLGTNDGLNFLRIARSAPFSAITYWEIGNEEYGSWETDHHGTAGPAGVSTGSQHDPATYAKFAATFAAFDAADAKLPAVSIGIDSGDPTGNSDGNWTRNVLANGYSDAFVPGFISDHSYMYGPGDENDSVLLNHTVSDSASNLDWSVRYADYEAMLSQTVGASASSVKVMATEYNSNYGTEGKQMTSLVNGLFVADSIGSLLNSGYTGGLFWDLRNGWTTDGNNSPTLYGWRQGGDEGILGTQNEISPPATGSYVAYPTYFAEQLASKIMQTGGIGLSASTSYSELGVYSVLEPNGHLDLMILNKNPDAALADTISLPGFAPSGQSQIWQYGESQDFAQSQSTTGASSLGTSTPLLAFSGSNVSYTFPAYSMTVIDLSPLASQSGSTLSVNLNSLGPVTLAASGSSLIVGQGTNSFTYSGITAVTVNGISTANSLITSGNITAPVTFTNSTTTTLNVSAGSLTIAASSATGIRVQTFAGVTVGSNATLTQAAAGSHTNRTLLVTPSLSIAGSLGHWTGTLDLTSNDLDVQNGSVVNLTDQLRQGNAGIVSSSAAGNSTHLTTLGGVLNTIDGTPTGAALYGAGTALGQFDGVAPATTDVLVKYTYFGDTNLDGKVDGSDYTRIDSGFLHQLTGWFNGDFNLDNYVDGSDYTLIDNAYNSQGGNLSTTAETASPAKSSRQAVFSPPAWSVAASTPFAVSTASVASILLSEEPDILFHRLHSGVAAFTSPDIALNA